MISPSDNTHAQKIMRKCVLGSYSSHKHPTDRKRIEGNVLTFHKQIVLLNQPGMRLEYYTNYMMDGLAPVINPRCACAARVTVLALCVSVCLCVCVCVCVCVCLSVTALAVTAFVSACNEMASTACLSWILTRGLSKKTFRSKVMA